MIVIRLKGGLGNQMFQYALGRYLSVKNNTELLLDTSSYRHDHLREYRLASYCIQAKASDQFLFFPTDGRARRFNRIIQLIQKIFSQPFQIIREKGFEFDPQVLACSNNAYLDGFWQSEKYFAPIANTIREDFRLKSAITDLLKTITQEIAATESVSIHVRRGDYISNPTTASYHGTCSVQWYQEAAKMMEEKLIKPTFFVFSDDYEWAKKNLRFNSTTVFVPPSPDGQECNDLYAMSLCKHNIIANSSFSWWGAWLNANSQKIVIAPQNWFIAGPKNTDNLIPKTWQRL